MNSDGELILVTPAGAVDLLLEWDRGTETLERLADKLLRYRMAEHKLDYGDTGPRSILFIVPGQRRLQNLRELCLNLGRDGSWPILATTAPELDRAGALAQVWQRLDVGKPGCSLRELPARHDLHGLDPALALGRRWRHDQPGFWERLSPLGRTLPTTPDLDLRPSSTDGLMDDPDPKERSWP